MFCTKRISKDSYLFTYLLSQRYLCTRLLFARVQTELIRRINRRINEKKKRNKLNCSDFTFDATILTLHSSGTIESERRGSNFWAGKGGVEVFRMKRESQRGINRLRELSSPGCVLVTLLRSRPPMFDNRKKKKNFHLPNQTLHSRTRAHDQGSQRAF